MKAFVAVALVLLTGGCGSSGPDPAPAASSAKPLCAGAAVTDVIVPTPAGARLTGYVIGTGGTGIVLAAQARSDACSWLTQAKALAARGYRVLAVNYSGEGGSTYVAGSMAPSGDVAAGAAYLRGAGATRIVLIGASRGGTAALVAAARDPALATAVISLSAPGYYDGENALDAAPNLRLPVLYAAATGDGTFADTAKGLHDATPDSRRRLVTVSGVAHGQALLDAADGTPLKVAVSEFLAAHAPPV